MLLIYRPSLQIYAIMGAKKNGGQCVRCEASPRAIITTCTGNIRRHIRL